MKTVLTGVIPVARVAVFAEMAWLERRPELGLLCRKARESEKRITSTNVQSVLPGMSDAGAKNIVAWCEMLGLCDKHGALTTLGETVADSDEAPVPEQGVYDLWIAQHPVIGSRVLAVERLAPRREDRLEDVRPLPIEPDRGKVFHSVTNPKERFQVRSLPTNQEQSGCIPGNTKATCRLRWTLDFDAGRDIWQLEGQIESPIDNGKHTMVQIQHQPESDGLDLWQLVGTWGNGPLSTFGRWQPEVRSLSVSFQGLTEVEITNFRRTLALGHVEVPGKGGYDNVHLEDVPVGPATAYDAQCWAIARLDQHTKKQPAYLSRAELRELFVELTEETPLAPFHPTLPSHDDLLKAQIKDPARFWLLAAPVDLSPLPVDPRDLDALRIGQAIETEGVESPGLVRVPYRGGWSMNQLVQRLLGDSPPRKVLLCDRYVRGPENLAALKLFVQAVRGAAPVTIFEIWTGEEEANFKQIQSMTSVAPRAYREVFGRGAPHDRYLLVLPGQGKGFGWQMSNSPLHARPDSETAGADSPLRWKDLIANRLSTEELPPTLRQWFNGGVK